jgi:hypothetical protein
MTWAATDFELFSQSEEITIQTERTSGGFRREVPIWIVPLGNDLYVRSSHGRDSGWFRGAVECHGALVSTGKSVVFVELVEVREYVPELDAAYSAKYAQYTNSFLPALLGAPAQAAALRLVPRPE